MDRDIHFQFLPFSTSEIETASLPGDHWIAASALQKAIRRCDAQVAERAALALYRWRGPRIWRRLAIVAAEDIGIGSIDAVVEAVAVCTDTAQRSDAADEVRLLLQVVRLLANAAKDRAADFLISAAHHHPSLAEARARLAVMPVADRIAFTADLSNGLHERALATWFATGIGVPDMGRDGKGDLTGLLAMYRGLGVPSQWLQAVRSIVKQTREPLALMLPPLWLAASGSSAGTVECPVPATTYIHDLPLYALDKHTRPGKRAIHQFARENVEVREILSRHVGKGNANAAACMAAFYADGACLARRRIWPGCHEVERLGIEADFSKVGVPEKAIQPLREAFARNLAHLDDVRARQLNAYLETLR